MFCAPSTLCCGLVGVLCPFYTVLLLVCDFVLCPFYTVLLMWVCDCVLCPLYTVLWVGWCSVSLLHCVVVGL